MRNMNLKTLSPLQKQELYTLVTNRFETNLHRHEQSNWEHIWAKVEEKPQNLWSLWEMEKTGGEPDVVELGGTFQGEILFCDCAPQSPTLRRSLCYDRRGREERKAHPPISSAVEEAARMGITLLTQQEYEALQALEAFDLKTSSWIHTPTEIRDLGGALFCDRRYNRVFVYHNGADSYYSVRGFRGILRL
ncbi:MAG: DUF4256 domain-containing protein [Clostridiales bacterium]|nr:DUF4256 domain-containing protein [Clostridiales bacterium]